MNLPETKACKPHHPDGQAAILPLRAEVRGERSSTQGVRPPSLPSARARAPGCLSGNCVDGAGERQGDRLGGWVAETAGGGGGNERFAPRHRAESSGTVERWRSAVEIALTTSAQGFTVPGFRRSHWETKYWETNVLAAAIRQIRLPRRQKSSGSRKAENRSRKPAGHDLAASREPGSGREALLRSAEGAGTICQWRKSRRLPEVWPASQCLPEVWPGSSGRNRKARIWWRLNHPDRARWRAAARSHTRQGQGRKAMLLQVSSSWLIPLCGRTSVEQR